MTFISKMVQAIFMIVWPVNIIVTAVVYYVYPTPRGIHDINSHMVPLIVTTLDFCINRIYMEASQWWLSLIYVCVYGFGVCCPVTLTLTQVYPILDFASLTGWLAAAGLFASSPIFYFICFGLVHLKLVIIAKDVDYKEPEAKTEEVEGTQITVLTDDLIVIDPIDSLKPSPF
jgi:hypothetical protein